MRLADNITTFMCQMSRKSGSLNILKPSEIPLPFLFFTKVVHMWEGRGVQGFWWGNLRERDHWGDPDADGRIILRWIFRTWEGVVGTGWSWLRIGTGGGHL